MRWKKQQNFDLSSDGSGVVVSSVRAHGDELPLVSSSQPRMTSSSSTTLTPTSGPSSSTSMARTTSKSLPGSPQSQSSVLLKSPTSPTTTHSSIIPKSSPTSPQAPSSTTNTVSKASSPKNYQNKPIYISTSPPSSFSQPNSLDKSAGSALLSSSTAKSSPTSPQSSLSSKRHSSSSKRHSTGSDRKSPSSHRHSAGSNRHSSASASSHPKSSQPGSPRLETPIEEMVHPSSTPSGSVSIKTDTGNIVRPRPSANITSITTTIGNVNTTIFPSAPSKSSSENIAASSPTKTIIPLMNNPSESTTITNLNSSQSFHGSNNTSSASNKHSGMRPISHPAPTNTGVSSPMVVVVGNNSGDNANTSGSVSGSMRSTVRITDSPTPTLMSSPSVSEGRTGSQQHTPAILRSHLRRSGESKHEKSKSVTIVVNDQHVSYNSNPETGQTTTILPVIQGTRVPTSGILINGEMATTKRSAPQPPTPIMKGRSFTSSDLQDNTRPSSAASGGGSNDPDIQVRPLVGWWNGTESVSAGSVLEDTASSDDCHRSTLTLVQNPSKTYLSGETGNSVVAEDGWESWSGVVSTVLGVALVVGAATTIRLPTMLYTNGAGTFLVAWSVVLLLVAIPLAYLESGLAQFCSSGPLSVWRLVPIARGVGWSTLLVLLLWCVIVAGYTGPLLTYGAHATHLLKFLPQGSSCENALHNMTSGDKTLHFYRSCIYHLPDNWNEGIDLTLSWPLPATIGTSVIIATIISSCGGRSLAALTGIASFLALAGIGVLAGLGAAELWTRDIWFMLEAAWPAIMPDFYALMEPKVWLCALGQVLLSMGLGVGTLMGLSSKHSFRFTLRGHLWLVALLLSLVTAVVSALTVLQLTIIATDRGVDITSALADIRNDNFSISELKEETTDIFITENVTEEVSTLIFDVEVFESSPRGLEEGVAFIAAWHLLQIFPFPFTWLRMCTAVFVYTGYWMSCLTVLSICIHTLINSLRESLENSPPFIAAAFVTAPIILAMATPSATQGGAAIVSILNMDILSLVVLWPPFTMALSVTAVYGIQKVRKDLTFMLESSVCWLWTPFWAFFIPLIILGIIVWSVLLGNDGLVVGVWPELWRTVVIWGLRGLVILPLILTALYVVQTQLAYGIRDKIVSSLQFSREWGDWGPQDPIEHHNWRRWREDESQPITSLKRLLAHRPLTYTHSTLSSDSSSTLTRLRNKYQRNGNAQAL